MTHARYQDLALKLLLSLLIVMAQLPMPVFAEPTGEEVIRGDVAFSRSGDVTTITASHNSIIQYSGFDIAANETVQFIQPSTQARVLNRIMGGYPTTIEGSLLANGIVYLVNPAGVLFTPTAIVDVGGIYAAAANLSNRDFLGNNNMFLNASGPVTNWGTIRGNAVHLVGLQVANHGSILVDSGAVTMVAGKDVYIGERGGHVLVRVEGTGAQAEAGAGPAVENTGTIDAGGGEVMIAAGDVFSLAFRNSGFMKGKNVTVDGGAGRVEVAGTIDASDASPGAIGGNVKVLGDEVVLQGAEIDASGSAGGGTVLVGGDFQGANPDVRNAQFTYVDAYTLIAADALDVGHGGQVIVWADGGTAFFGTISARGGPQGGNGGFAEVSGKRHLMLAPELIDLSAPMGAGGVVLFDPDSIVIQDAPEANVTGFVTPAWDETYIEDLGTASVFNVPAAGLGTFSAVPAGTSIVLQAKNTITVSSAVDLNIHTTDGGAGTNLTLEAGGDILLSASVTLNSGTLTLNANNAGGTQTGTGQVTVNQAVVTGGGDFVSTGINFTTGAAGTIATAGGNVNINNTGVVTVGAGINAAAGNVSIQGASSIAASGGAIQGAALTAKTQNDAGGAITIDNAANDFTTVDLRARNALDNANAAGAITYRDATGFDVVAARTTSTVSLTAGDAITDSGLSTGTTLTAKTLKDGGAAITLNDVNNDFATIDLRARNAADGADAAGAIEYRDVNGFDVAAAQTTSTVTLTGKGDITDSGTLAGTTLTVKTLKDGGAAITLNSANAFATVDLQARNAADTGNAAGAIAYVDADGFDVAAIQTGSTLSLTAAGAITNSGQVDVGGTTTLVAGAANDITLDVVSNDFGGAVTVTSGQNVTLVDADALTFAGATVSGNLDVTALGLISDTGQVTVAGTTRLQAGAANSIELNTGTNDFVGAVTITSGNNVTLVDANALTFAGATVSGNLDVTALGLISDTGQVAVTGTTRLQAGAGNHITLDFATNNFGGAVTITSGNNVTLVDANALTFAGATVSGALDVTALGLISDTGQVTVAGTTRLQAGAANNIELNTGTNDFVGAVTVTSGNNVTLVDANALTFAGATVSGNLDVTALGLISDTGQVTVTGTTRLEAGAANHITLDFGTNDFGGAVTVTSGNNVTLVDANALTFAGATVSGNLDVTAAGLISDTGQVTVAGTTRLEAGAANHITLDFATNNFGGAVTVTSGNNVTLVDANALSIDAITAGAAVVLTAGGAITDTGVGALTGTTLTAKTLSDAGAAIELDTLTNDFAAIDFRSRNGADAVTSSGNLKYRDASGFTILAAETTGGRDFAGSGDMTLNVALPGGTDFVLDAGAGAIIITADLGTVGNPMHHVELDGTRCDLGANIYSQGASLIFNLPVVLTANTAHVDVGPGGGIYFNDTVNGDGLGPWDLTLTATAGDPIRFGDGVGGDRVGDVNALDVLTVNTGTAQINTDVVKAAKMDFNAPVEIQTSTALTATAAAPASVRFRQDVNSQATEANNLTVTAPEILFDANAGTAVTGAFGTLTINSGDGVTAGSAFTPAGQFVGTTLVVKTRNDAGAAITMSNAANDFTTVDLRARTAADGANAAGAIAYVDVDGFDVAAIQTTTTLSLTGGGTITDSGALSVGGTTTLDSGVAADIALDVAANDFVGAVTVTNADNVTLVDANVLSIDAIAAGTAVILTARTGITDTGVGALTGTTLTAKTLNDGGAGITLDTAGNDFTTVDLQARNAVDGANANGPITYRDATGFDVAAAQTTSRVTLINGGAVTQSAPIQAAELRLSGTGSYTLGMANAVGTLAADATDTLKFTDVDGLVIGTVDGVNGITMAGENVTLTAGGALTQTQAIAAAGLRISGAGAATLQNAANDVDTLAADATDTLKFTDVDGLAIGTVDGVNGITMAGENVTLTAGGALTQTQAIAAGATWLDTGANDITLDVITNDFDGAVTITNGRHVTLVDVNALELADATVSGNLDATADGALTGSGAVVVTGTTRLEAGVGAGHDIDFQTITNDFGGAVTIWTGQDVTLVDANDIDIAFANVSGSLAVTADDGGITGSGQVVVVGTTYLEATTPAGHDITFATATNDFVGAVTVTSANNVRLVDTNNLSLALLTATADVRLQSVNGAITDGNAAAVNIDAANLALRAATGIGSGNALETQVNQLAASNTTSGAIQIDNSSGGLLTIGTVDTLVGVTNAGAGAGAIVITNASPLTVSTPVTNTTGGDITLTSTNDGGNNDHLTLNAQVAASGGNGSINLNAGTDLVISNSAPANDVSVAGNGAITGIAERHVQLAAGARLDASGGSGNVLLTADSLGAINGGVVNLADTSVVHAGSGTITLNADGNVTVSYLETTSAANPAVAINTTSGGVVDADAGAADDIVVLSGRLVINSVTGVGAADAIDTRALGVAVANTGAADIHIFNTQPNTVDTTIYGLTTVGNITFEHTGAYTAPAGPNANLVIDGNVTSGVALTDGGNIIITTRPDLQIGLNLTLNALRTVSSMDVTLPGYGALNVSGATINGTITVGEGDITLTGGAPDTIIGGDQTTGGTQTWSAIRDVIVRAGLTTTTATADINLLADTDLDGDGGVWIDEAGGVPDAFLNSGRDVMVSGSDVFNIAVTTESVQVDADGANYQITAVGDVTLESGLGAFVSDIVVNGRVGSTGAAAGTVEITAANRILLGVADGVGSNLSTVGGNIDLKSAVLLTADVLLASTAGNVTFDNFVDALDNAGPASAYGLTVNTDAGNTTFTGQVGGGSLNTFGADDHGLEYVTTDAAVVGGNLFLGADVTTSGGTMTFNDPVVLTADVTLTDTGATGIAFNSTVDTATGLAAGLGDLTLVSTGPTVFVGAVGSNPVPGVTKANLGSGTGAAITINSAGTTEFQSTVAVASGMTQAVGAGLVTFRDNVNVAAGTADSLFNENVVLDGLTFTSAKAVTFGNAGGDTLMISTALVTVDTSAASQLVTVNSATTLNQDLTITTGGGNIVLNGTINGNNDLVLNSRAVTDINGVIGGLTPVATLTTDNGGGGAAERTELGANVSAQGGTITFNDPLLLMANVLLTDSGTTGVLFNNTVDGPWTLDVVTTGGGNTTFGGLVGNTTPLTSLTTDTLGAGDGKTIFNAAGTVANPTVETTGAQTYHDAVEVQAATVLTATGAAGHVTFNLTVDSVAAAGAQALTVVTTGGGDTTFNGLVGDTTPLASLTTDTLGAGDGRTLFNAAGTVANPTVETTGNQTYNDAVELQAKTVLQSVAGGITFNGTVDGGQALVVNAAAGNVTFAAGVGDTTPLASMAVTSNDAAPVMPAGAVNLLLHDVRTVGNQVYSVTGTIELVSTAVSPPAPAVPPVLGPFPTTWLATYDATAGGIEFNTGRELNAVPPLVATIFNRGGNVIINAGGGDFTMHANDKLTVVGTGAGNPGDLAIMTSNNALLGDLNALRNIIVNAGVNIQPLDRPQGQVLNYSGTFDTEIVTMPCSDFVAGGDISFDKAPLAQHTFSDPDAHGTPAGTLAAQIYTEFPLALQPMHMLLVGQVLDMVPQGPTATNPADTIAGAAARLAMITPQDLSLTPAQREVLMMLNIPSRDLTAQEAISMLLAGYINDYEFNRGRDRLYVATARFPRSVVAPLATAYASFLGEGRVNGVKAALQKAWDAYRQAAPPAQDPQALASGFYPWLVANRDKYPEVFVIAERLNELIVLLGNIGLSQPEFNQARHGLLLTVKPEGMEADQLESLIGHIMAEKQVGAATP